MNKKYLLVCLASTILSCSQTFGMRRKPPVPRPSTLIKNYNSLLKRIEETLDFFAELMRPETDRFVPGPDRLKYVKNGIDFVINAIKIKQKIRKMREFTQETLKQPSGYEILDNPSNPQIKELTLISQEANLSDLENLKWNLSYIESALEDPVKIIQAKQGYYWNGYITSLKEEQPWAEKRPEAARLLPKTLKSKILNLAKILQQKYSGEQ